MVNIDTEDFFFRLNKYISNIDECFNKKISLKKIEILEKEIGGTLPKEFKNLYLKHDGENNDIIFGAMGGMRLMSFDDINYAIKDIIDAKCYIENDNLKITKSGSYKKQWIPFAEDFQGKYLMLDLDPDINGNYGQVIILNTEKHESFLIAESFDDFLDMVIERLFNGDLEVKEIGKIKVLSWKRGNAYVYASKNAENKKEETMIQLDSVWQNILKDKVEEKLISVKNLENIKELYISEGLYKNLDSISLDILCYMVNLNSLTIYANMINRLDILRNLKCLEEVTISGYQLTEDEIEDFKYISNLSKLSLENMVLNDVFIIGHLKNLKKLRLCHVNLMKSNSLSVIDHLESIELESMKIDDLSFIRKIGASTVINLKWIR